jgi:hypothetical protein
MRNPDLNIRDCGAIITCWTGFFSKENIMGTRNHQQFAARLPLIILGWLGAAVSGTAQTHVVQKYMGNTPTTTSTFTVGDNWEVAWEDPSPVRFTLYSDDGKIVAGAAGVLKGSFYLPKGGTYYLQVDSATSNPVGSWQLSIVEQGTASASGANDSAHVSFPPPATAPATNAVSVAAPAVAAAAPTKLTDDETNAVVMIEGDKAEGTGFLVKLPDGPAVVTNIHVLAGNPNVRILTNTGAQIAILGLKGATDRDLAVFSIQDAHYSYLTLNSAIGSSVQVGDDVITPGNSQGGEVVLATHGSVVGIGPQRIEINNPIYHGNSGGPVFQTRRARCWAW